MKKTTFLSILWITALLLAGCGFGKMIPRYPEVNVKLENPDLENRGGKVEYKVTGSIPAKYLKKKATMTITPTLEYEGGSYALNTIQLQGEKAKATGTVIPYKTGGTFATSGSFDYKDQYEEAIIVAKSQANLKKKSHTFEDKKLGEGIANTASRSGLTPALKEKSDIGNGTNIILGTHQYKPEYITETATIYFEVDKYNLNMNLKLNKDQLAKDLVQKFIDFIYEGRVINKIVITGWASPEGEESRNQDLSKNRTDQGKKWFEEQFEKYLKDYAKKNNLKYKDMPKPELVIDTKASGEDWSGFEKAVEKSNITEKNQILNVVRAQNNSELKEQKIREMTDIYNEIKEMILPPLRRVEVAMTCNKHSFNDTQIAEFAKTKPDTLNLEELLYGAYMTQSLADKANIYQTIINNENYQKEWRAYNNLAALELNSFLENKNSNDLEKAKSNLNKANAVSPSNGIILNNMAIVEFLYGNRDVALTYFQESKNATVEPINQNYNLALLNIASGDYSGAKQLMNNKNCDYNMALVQVLEKDYTAAKTSLDCIPNKDAKVFYLQAVVAARVNNANDVIANLKEAIARDASYKVTAKKDAEFKKFKKSSEFQALIQ